MALQKAFTHNSGVGVSYWRIVKVDTNYATETGTIHIYGYVDQASRNAGNGHLMVKTVYFDNAVDNPVFDDYFAITKINGSGKNPIKNAYDYLKSISGGEFSDAVDILE